MSENEFQKLCELQSRLWEDRKPISVAALLDRSSTRFSDQQILELIRVDLNHRQKDGGPCDPLTYATDFPHLKEQIHSFFESNGYRHQSTAQDVGEFEESNSRLKRQISIATSDSISNFDQAEESFEIVNRDDQELGFPRKFGNYELIKHLGHGGLGDVFLARHHKFTDRQYAIKQIRTQRISKEAIARFEKEIDVAGRVQHPNLVFAVDAGVSDECPYLVMELVDGVDLQKLMASGRVFNLKEATEIIRQVAIGLQHIHDLGMAHRDIKPSNLMLCSDGTVKILDLGLASIRQDNAHELTVQGEILGTPDYMAPEQWKDTKSVDIRADIYSLGCTYYCLLAGHSPFKARATLVEKMNAHLNDEPLSISEIRDDIPVELITIIDRCLDKEKSNRFSIPQEIVEALDGFAKEDKSILASNALNAMKSEVAIDTRSIKRSDADTDADHSPNKDTYRPTKINWVLPAILALSMLLIFGYAYGRGFLGLNNSDAKNRNDANDPPASPNRPNLKTLVVNRLDSDPTVRYASINDNTPDGRVVYEGERASIEVAFHREVYFLVFALTPAKGEGKVQRIWPSDQEDFTKKATLFLFPKLASESHQINIEAGDSFVARNGTWRFSDGIGMHAFFVVSSTQPLPSFAECKSELLKVNWNSESPLIKNWTIRKGAALLNQYDAGSHQVTSRGVVEGEPGSIQPVVDFIQSVFPDADVDGIAFNVERPL